jgi:hypothetical protein
MRCIVVVLLTLYQFTALPFLSMVAASTARQQERPSSVDYDQDTQVYNVTTIYKKTLEM